MPQGELVLPPTTLTQTIPPDFTVGQPQVKMSKSQPIDWAENPPSSPEELGDDWEDITDPRNNSGSRNYKNKQTGEEIRWDPKKPDATGWESTDHWHRVNPNNKNKGDAYLDKNGNPVSRGSNGSHIQAPKIFVHPEIIVRPPTRNFFQKVLDNIKDFFKSEPKRDPNIV